MRKLVFSIAGVFSFVIAASGQVNESKNFLYLFSDSVIYGRNVEFRSPILARSYFLIDSRKVDAGLVKFYKNDFGFFGNIKNPALDGSSVFMSRIIRGKINLYEKQTFSYNFGNYIAGPNMYSPGMVHYSIKDFYNIGYGNLKKPTYKNLSVDLADNAESMLHLNKYKSRSDAQLIFSIVGGAALIGGVATFISKNSRADRNGETEPNVTPNIVAICAGAGCLWVSYFISISKPKHLRRAIETYNGKKSFPY